MRQVTVKTQEPSLRCHGEKWALRRDLEGRVRDGTKYSGKGFTYEGDKLKIILERYSVPLC